MSKKRGDRKDGRLIRNIDGFHFIMPYLMPNRCDAEVYIEELIDVTELVKYIDEENQRQREYKLTPFHVITAAVGKIVYHRPYLNRFIAGRRLYQRNKITLAFVVKRKFNDEAEESLMVTEIKGDTTLEHISSRIAGGSEAIRKEGGNDINDLLNKLSKLPRCVMRFAMCIFRFLDFHGWMPESICKGDSNYATVLLSNLGSIKCNAVYHHLNNYGTNSIVITIGKIHKEQVVNQDGTTSVRDVVAIGATADERIADGFYFARSIRMLEKVLKNPKQLENEIRTEIAGLDEK